MTKRTSFLAMSLLLLGAAGCASDPQRYYVASDGKHGDYYLAPPAADDYGPGYADPFCPWGPYECGPSYDPWRFSFGFSYGPWSGHAHHHPTPKPPPPAPPEKP